MCNDGPDTIAEYLLSYQPIKVILHVLEEFQRDIMKK